MRLLSPFLISLLLGLFLVAAPVEVGAQPVPVSTTEVRSQALDRLAQQLVAYFQVDGTLTLEPQRAWNPPALATGWEMVVAEYPKELTSSLLVRVRLISGGEVVSEPTLLLRAQLMREVYFAKLPIEREALFEPSRLEVRTLDVLRERDPVLVSSVDKDMMFNRAISAGRLITWTDLSRRPMVRRGEIIEVAASDGMMTIVLRAQALDSGSQGDVVRVRNVESRKDFNAFVVADNRAEVRF